MNKEKNIEKLCKLLGLSNFQKQQIQDNYEKYNISGLIKRGKVLYAPYKTDDLILRFFMGELADLIGEEKMLIQNSRGIEFFAFGYHSLKIGDKKYYADPTGQIVTKKSVFDVLNSNKTY